MGLALLAGRSSPSRPLAVRTPLPEVWLRVSLVCDWEIPERPNEIPWFRNSTTDDAGHHTASDSRAGLSCCCNPSHAKLEPSPGAGLRARPALQAA